MKVAITNNSNKLISLFHKIPQFEEYILFDSFEDLKKEKKVRYIFAEQNDLVAADLAQIRASFPNSKILILSKSEDPFFEKTCLVHEILLLIESWEEERCVQLIQHNWFGQLQRSKYKNVFAIFGTHRCTGVTQTALSLGNVIGGLNLKTLVIGLNPYSSGEYPGIKATYSFDMIYDLVENDVIKDGETLLPYLTKLEYCYYLVGNRDLYKALTFQPEPIMKLIDYAKDYFNVVLLDVGAFFDSYMAKIALENSNTHILISTQEQQAIDEFTRWNEQILSRFNYYPKSSYQIVNKYASRAIIQSKSLEEALKIPVLAEIPYFPESNDAVVTEGILYNSDFKPYVKAIDGIARVLVNEVIPDERQHNRSFLSRFRKGVV